MQLELSDLEKLFNRLQQIEQKTKVQKTVAATFSEIDSMGRKTFTGKLELTPKEGEMLKDLAKKGISADATIADLKHKLSSARKDARIWKERYEVLMSQVKDFLAAIRKAPERVKAFIDRILDTEKAEPEQPKKLRETTLVK